MRICASSTEPPSPIPCSAAAPARGLAAIARPHRYSTRCTTHCRRARIRSRRTGSPLAARWPPCSIGFRSAIRRAGRQPPRRMSRLRNSTASSTPAPASARHVCKHGFIPGYAAFNLIGDPDFRGSDLLIALQGSMRAATRTQRCCSTSRARFIAGSAAAAAINPPWARHGRANVVASADPPSLGILRCILRRGADGFLRQRSGNGGRERKARHTIEHLIGFCLQESRERVPSRIDGARYDVVTAIAPAPHPRFSRFFANIKADLGFELYVPDCDTTACSLSAASQFGSQDAILDQPMVDFYAGYQIGQRSNREMLTVPINDNIDFRRRHRDLDRECQTATGPTATTSTPR